MIDYFFNTEEERDKYLMDDALQQIENDKTSGCSNAINPRSLKQALIIARNGLDNRIKYHLKKDIHPKEIQIRSRYQKNHLYTTPANLICVQKSSYEDTFISNVDVQNKDLEVEILYSGNWREIPVELIDELFCTGDSSDNPLRPFRWYRGNNITDCADTNSPESIESVREKIIESYIEALKSEKGSEIKFVCIYELS